MRFHSVVQLGGKTATGIPVPEEVVTSLGSSKRPPVRVTINGHTYRSTLASRGGQFMLPISAENRTSAGVAAGDDVLQCRPTWRRRSSGMWTPRGTSRGCRIVKSSGTCSRSSKPRQPRLASDASTKHSVCCERAGALSPSYNFSLASHSPKRSKG